MCVRICPICSPNEGACTPRKTSGSHSEVAEEHRAQRVGVVLTGVNERVVGVLVEQRDDPAQPDDLRPGTEDRHHLHRSNSPSAGST